MGLLTISELGWLGAGVIGTAYSHDPYKEIDQAIKDLESSPDRCVGGDGTTRCGGQPAPPAIQQILTPGPAPKTVRVGRCSPCGSPEWSPLETSTITEIENWARVGLVTEPACRRQAASVQCQTAPSIAVGEPYPSGPIMPPPPLVPSAEHEARMDALRLQRERLEAELKREELLRLRMRKRPAPRPPVTGSAAPSTPAPRPQPVRLRREPEGYSNLLLFAAGVVVALLLTR